MYRLGWFGGQVYRDGRGDEEFFFGCCFFYCLRLPLGEFGPLSLSCSLTWFLFGREGFGLLGWQAWFGYCETD